MKFEEIPPSLLEGIKIMTAQVAVCDSLRQADAIKGALEAMKHGAVDPMIYVFAAGQYLVLVMGDVINGGTDVQNTNP
jgi:hypothetical protein